MVCLFLPNCTSDDNSAVINAKLDEKLVDWKTLDIIPTESVLEGFNTNQALLYGLYKWTDFFLF